MPSLLESVKNLVVPNSELNGKPLEHWNLQQQDQNTNNSQKGDDYWKETLSEKEFEVLRNKGTEASKSSVYNKHQPKKGYFACRACGNPLYSFKHKFESGCGWPAFGKFVEDSIETRDDYSMRMKRYVVCLFCF
jgi:peptide-methionine (R)-S-oxide reductase